MKKLNILFFTLSFFYSGIVHGQWATLNANTDYALNDVFFIDANTGYIAGGKGDSGIILKTSDAGDTWDATMWKYPVVAIHFPSNNVGYTLAQKDTFLKTTDGGDTWMEDTVSSGGTSLKGIYFADENTGFCGAGDDIFGDVKIYTTINGGNTWNVNTIHSGSFEDFVFTSSQTGYLILQWLSFPDVVSDIWKTTDAGNSWQLIATFGNAQLNSIFSATSEVHYACGDESVVIKSTDAGETWVVKDSSISSSIRLNSIYCPDKATCYTVGDSGTILKTTDGGDTWVKQSSGTVADLRSVFCTDSYCYAVGDSGTILRAPNDTETTINDTDLENNIKVFPNPAGHTLTLEYPIGLDVQHIALYDLHGRIVREYPAYAVMLDLSGIALGKYILRVKTAEGTVSKKVMVTINE